MRLFLALAVLIGVAGCGSKTSSVGSHDGGTSSKAKLDSVEVTPKSSFIPLGATQMFAARAHYSDGTTVDVTASATWSLSAAQVGSVSSIGVVTSVAEGGATVTATFAGVQGSAGFTGSASALSALGIAPLNVEVGIGGAQRFVATGTFSDGTTRNVTAAVSWSSSAPQLAALAEAGLFKTVAQGQTTVTAVAGAITASNGLTVTAKQMVSLQVTPAFISLSTVESEPLAALATYTDGSTATVTDSVTWTSSLPASVTVSAGGLISGVSALTGIGVTASFGLVSSLARVSVTLPQAALIGLTLAPQTMWVGQTFPAPQLAAAYGDGKGSNYFFASWTSSNPAVAEIDFDKGVTAKAAGTTTLTASTTTPAGVLTASNVLTVIEPPLGTISVQPGSAPLALGSTLSLTAVGGYVDTTVNQDVTAKAVWSSSNPNAVTVDAAGKAKAVGTGSATVTAALDGVSGTAQLSVPSTVPPQSTVTLSPQDDNSVLDSSLTPATEVSVYAYNAFFTTPGVAVGCAWYWSPPIGFVSERIDVGCGNGLIKFDVSSLAGKSILSAKLRLATAVYGVGFVPRAWFIQALASAWSGASVTWDASIYFQHYLYSRTEYAPPTSVGQVYELDQTNTVRNWVAGSYLNDGWQLGLTNYVLPNIHDVSLDPFEFYSKESSNGLGPKLIVTYQ